jgi:hypothetical protein
MAASAAPPPSATALTSPQDRNSKLTKTTNTLKYLYDPTTAPQPSHLRSRTFLRSLRYISIFVFWRLVRYAKYAAMGALATAVAGTAIGSVASGAAFVIAPTGILGGAGVGLLWAVGKFGWRWARMRVDGRGRERGLDPRRDEREDAEGEEEVKAVRVPRTEPW